jgi:hypothetical protein
LQISLSSPYSSPISGQAIITFSPDVGGGDGSIQFAGGGATASFEIPVGSTEAISSPALALQTGTVAGTISVSLRLQSGGLDATPSPAPEIATRIDRGAPAIRSARVIRRAGGFDIEVVGFSTAREVTQATYRFSPAPGQSLQVSQVVVPLESLFSSWFQNSANNVYGSQFVLTEPFTIQGDANAVLPQSVTLTNRFGDVTLSLTE